MAKDPKDTPEVTPAPPPAHPQQQVPATTAQPLPTDPNDPNAVQPSQKTQEEIAAGQAALDAGPKFERPRVLDPANADPALAAETATAMNLEHEAEDLEEPEDWVEPGQPRPDEVPSRGIPAGGLLPGEVPPQGTPDRREMDPRIQDSPKGTDPAVARAEYYRKQREEEIDQKKQQREQQKDKHKAKG